MSIDIKVTGKNKSIYGVVNISFRKGENMRANKFVGEAYEELTLDEMRMAQGSGEIEDEGAIKTLYIQPEFTAPSAVTLPVLLTHGLKC